MTSDEKPDTIVPSCLTRDEIKAGVYQWHDKIVLVEDGKVFSVLGKNNYIGLLKEEKFKDGWIQKLDVVYDP